MDIVRRKLCLVTIGMTFDAKERLMNVACIIRMYGVKHTQKTLGWRSVTSGYHGKISGLHQSFLTETVICCQTMEETYGLPSCSWVQSCTGKSYMSFFFCRFFFCRICRTTVFWDPEILLPWQREVTTSFSVNRWSKLNHAAAQIKAMIFSTRMFSA